MRATKGRAVRTFARLAFALTLGLAAGPAGAQEISAKGIFEGHGVVKAVAPGTGWLTLDHDAIKGFMCAMEMMFQSKVPTSARTCILATWSTLRSTPRNT